MHNCSNQLHYWNHSSWGLRTSYCCLLIFHQVLCWWSCSFCVQNDVLNANKAAMFSVVNYSMWPAQWCLVHGPWPDPQQSNTRPGTPGKKQAMLWWTCRGLLAHLSCETQEGRQSVPLTQTLRPSPPYLFFTLFSDLPAEPLIIYTLACNRSGLNNSACRLRPK